MDEEEEQSRYVAQLKAEFDSCDTTATGYLDRGELSALCRRLQLDAHLPVLLETLLGEREHSTVNFNDFKSGFVSVLSRSLDFSTSEDDSSYLQPAIPEEVKPKFVRGAKRYGRRSRPDGEPDSASPPSQSENAEPSSSGVRGAKLRRATSLDSVESLKLDEETGNEKNVQPSFQKEEASHALPTPVEFNPDGLRMLCGSAQVLSSTPIRSLDTQGKLYTSSGLFAPPSLLTATVGQRILSRLDDGSGCASPERVAALWTEEGIRNPWDILQFLDFSPCERLSLADLAVALDNELLVSDNGLHQAALISYKNEIQHLQEVGVQTSRERDKLRADLDQLDQRNQQLLRELEDHHASLETLNRTRIRDLEQDYRERVMALRWRAEQESESLLQQAERERRLLGEELRRLRSREAELQEELSASAEENRRMEAELNDAKIQLGDAQKAVSRVQGELQRLLQEKLGVPDAGGDDDLADLVKSYELRCRELRDHNDELSSELEVLRSGRKSRRKSGDVWRHSDSDDSDMKRISSPAGKRKLKLDDKTALSSLDDVPAVSIQTELALEQLKQKHEQDLQQLNIQMETQVNYYERSLEKMRQSMEVERKDISQAFKLEISELEEQKEQAELQVKQLKEELKKIQERGGGGWSAEHERRMQRERAEMETNFAREIRNLVQNLSSEKEQLEAELQLEKDRQAAELRTDSAVQRLEVQELLLHLQTASDGLPQDRILRNQMESLETDRLILKDRVLAAADPVSLLAEELRRLDREKRAYMVLVEQLSTQIVEMEEEIRSLRDQLTGLSAQLNDTADLVLRLREQKLDSRTPETGRLVRQLMDLENLVLDLENLVDPAGTHRSQLDEVRLENGALQERLSLLQQEVQTLEDSLTKKRTSLEELEREHERSREEEERLRNENCGYREEVLELSRRNLELSGENGELSARLHGDQETVRILQRKLAKVEEERRERETEVQRLLDATRQQERELSSAQSKLSSQSQLEAEFLKLQRAEQERERLEREMDDRNKKVETLQQQLVTLETEAELLRSQLLGHAHQVTALQKNLQGAQSKVMVLEDANGRLEEEREETQRLRIQNQELLKQDLEVHKLTLEQQNLQTRLEEAQNQVVRADAALRVAQARLQERAGSQREAELLQEQLEEARRRNEDLQEALKLKARQCGSRIDAKQEQYEKAASALEQKVEVLQVQLKGVRLVLQEKAEQLREQMERSAKTSALLKDVYVENAQLMKALDVTEQRQKNAERRSFLLEEKVGALNGLLREIVPAALVT